MLGCVQPIHQLTQQPFPVGKEPALFTDFDPTRCQLEMLTRPEEKGAENDDIDPDAPHETEENDEPDRGYFVDVKTLAAALTSQSHSLESLSELLNVPTKKAPSEEHGGPLTEEYIRYGLRDVQTTWECFDALAQRFATFGLVETGLYDLYSEASLGKAYLKTVARQSRWESSDNQDGFAAVAAGE